MNRSPIKQLSLIVVVAFLSCSACCSSTVFPNGESAYLSCAPDGIPFVVADSAWAVDKLGNHRAVVSVSSHNGNAVVAVLPWRRSDLNPARKRIVVYDAATGLSVRNVKTYRVSAEKGVVVFQPAEKGGIYHIYYLPYVFRRGYGSGRWDSRPWEDYVPASGNNNYFEKNSDTPVPLTSDRANIPAQTADTKWLASLPADPEALEKASVLRFESRLRFDFPTPMGLIATREETKDLLAQHPENPILFTEDRAYPIRLTDRIPVRWIENGPSDTFEGSAMRNEYYVWQIGLWSPREKTTNVRLTFSDLIGKNGRIAASEITCFNQEGINWDGNPLEFRIDVQKGKVQALWCGVQIPDMAHPGKYKGRVTLTADGIRERILDVTIRVQKERLKDRGEGELWRHARLAWLNSTIGIDDEPVAPYQAMEVDSERIRATGKTLLLQGNGLPQAIAVDGKEILEKPVRFVVETQGGDVTFDACGAAPEKIADGLAIWHTSSRQQRIRFECEGRMEFDGYIRYKMNVSSFEPIAVKDIRLLCDYTPQASEYFIGIGYEKYKGGFRPACYKWNWNGPWDSFWTGGTDAGLHLEFLGGSYHGPLLEDYKPAPPRAWSNGGKGSVAIFGARGKPAQAVAATGSITLSPEPETFEFALMITPVKPVNTWKHFSKRYSHGSTGMEEAAIQGANVQNLHHATRLNPVINYPFIVQQPLIDYIREQHRHDRKVKLYYTVRELSNFAAEIFALKSLNHEIFPSGWGHGLPWLCEHLTDDYKLAWFTEIDGDQYDASLVVNGFSRWINYYLEGLRWMFQNYEIDGVYLDDVAYDRPVLKRMRKIMEQYRPGSLIDLHSHEQYSMGPANQYMGFFPYIDRLWFGEGFDYEKKRPDEWLITFSGIPFGLMSEMIERVNPWLGMVYGATGRYGYEEKYSPAPVWALWQSFGIEEAEMKGYWVKDCPVKTSHPLVKATAYLKPEEGLISVGNFDSRKQSVKLTFDWDTLGISPETAVLIAPEIEGFQPAATFRLRESIPIEAKKGWLLIVK
ncbi:putative lipoprotein [Bacteroidetes bacterium oral taxon 272 str. F0290]|nr:putative lipoprotein [Bacteroidetes bacterium oral taxon 272 str. F0290]